MYSQVPQKSAPRYVLSSLPRVIRIELRSEVK